MLKTHSLLLLTAIGLGYLLFWPLPVDPLAWTPPESRPLRHATSYMPEDIERLLEPMARGPETVIADDEGRVYAGLEDGRIIRVETCCAQPVVVADTTGRPLGIDLDAERNLIVADLAGGLISISPQGATRTLATEADGQPFRFINDVAVAKDGTILFTDSSSKRGPEGYLDELIEHRPNGRLLAHDPASGTTRVLLGGLFFPNGVALSPDQDYALVSETAAYRVKRYWLTGPNAGTADVFVDALPGFPDGLSTHGERVWVALYAPRNRLLDALMPYPFLRKILARLPTALLPTPNPTAWVLGLDADGAVVYSLRDPSGRYGPVSSVIQHGEVLYLGSLTDTAIGRVSLPDTAN